MITMAEKPDSRSWTEKSRQLRFTVAGTPDDNAVWWHVFNNTPTIYSGCARTSIRISPVFVDTVTESGVWDADIEYGMIQGETPETGVFAFDTTGGTQHVTQSIRNVQRRAPEGQTAPDFGGAIGVTHDNVEGVTISSPTYTFSETRRLPVAAVTFNYRNQIFWLTGKVNNATFQGLEMGECLFLGASGSRRSNDDWEINFRFASSPNRIGLEIGPITGINKKGWEYLWVRYAEREDTAARAVVKRPVAAYVEQVYEYGNFAVLGL